MLNSLKRINGTTIQASDGAIGEVAEAYFDDERWTVRYLVVDTGNWLNERKVLISPYAVKHPARSMGEPIEVNLSKQQVQDSPDIDTHKPVSRRHEQEFLGYYAYPDYWGGGELWAMGGFPIVTPTTPADGGGERIQREQERVAPEDVHLRSSEHVSGYEIQANDGSIGHVSDFILDDESWAIRYLVVDTNNWWPGGKSVLIAVDWIDSIDWSERKVWVKLTRQQVRNSPPYEEARLIERGYEEDLYAQYGRTGYWD